MATEYPQPLPGGYGFELWGLQLCITNAKVKSGWDFTVHEWDGQQWAVWFKVPHVHFATGWAQARNRARKALLEGARPALLAAKPDLAALNAYWATHGKHALALDNPHHDHYGLDKT
jgi:hypothetical protein